ncbi:MAG: carboxylesterase family protein [Bacteroidaceae bacterium]|nr:carboxylesterase family protein [Bacteroidaceae bacterium]
MKTIIQTLLIILALSSCHSNNPLQIRVEGGLIEGTADEGLSIYKGIPFAAPPVGELRWKAPQPVQSWDGVLETREFAPSPMQADTTLNTSEDCLYLNVWTPAKSKKDRLPVMVWIYGGGFSIGSTSYPYSDGAELARKGVVVASIAYRVGYLGFLAHPELSAENAEGVSGNYGLLDQIAALRWIRDNIGTFGGDPSNVTIFGQSAGGISVSMLCASPLAKGLFKHAISQSGGSFSPCREDSYPGENMKSLEMAESDGLRYALELGANSLTGLRSLPDTVFSRPYNATGGAWPIIDGYVIPDDQYRLYQAGNYNDVDILIGYNSDEGESFTASDSLTHIGNVRQRFGEYASLLLDAYPVTSNPVPKSGRDLLRDASFGWHTWAWGCLQAETGSSNVFMYYFDRHDDNAVSDIGSVHGSEVAYVFQHTGDSLPGDQELKRQIGDYWVNFATTGNPNAEGLPYWPAFTNQSRQVMYLTNQGSHAGPVPDANSMLELDGYFASRRKIRQQLRQKERTYSGCL